MISYCRDAINRLRGRKDETEQESLSLLALTVEQARRDWQYAQDYYCEVTDEDMDLLDYSVYQLKACEKKYTYLLRLARRQGLRCPLRSMF